MTPEQKVAYIQAQAACAIVEAAGMTAENNIRMVKGDSMAYSDVDFFALIDRYGIGRNAVLTFFQEE